MAKLAFRIIVRVTCRFLVNEGLNAGPNPLNCALHRNPEWGARRLEFKEIPLAEALLKLVRE
jgi:hypothetical protein